jgi:formate hydrogenlyase subunit 3/multisubunit Na+/H+ antiporter MnhD subunit
VIGYLLVLGSVRTRRTAATTAQFTAGAMLVAALLIGWARFRQGAPYVAAYQWINLPVAFTGDQRFQGFGIDLSLRIDHTALVAVIAALVVLLACVTWHRAAGRAEQGPIRFTVNVLMLTLGTVGVLVSGDLAELLAFWAAAGIATYLILGHRWGTEGAGQRGRVALAFPIVGDVALLCAVGLIYSRYGTLTISTLLPELTTTLGVGEKSLTTIAALLFVAVAVRACVWPFTAWQTATVEAPAAGLALVSSLWPIMAGTLLLRLQPVLAASGVQSMRIVDYTLVAAALIGPLLSLLGVELRRALLLASSGAIALSLIGVVYQPTLGVGFMAVLAVAAGRAAALLAGSSAATAMRTVDLRAMGGGWQQLTGGRQARRRMPYTSATLLLAGAVLALAPMAIAMLRPNRVIWVAFVPGLVLVALAALRPYFAIAHGELKRRRAFEPERVEEVLRVIYGSALVCAVLGAAAVVLSYFPQWIKYLGAGGETVGRPGAELLWVLAPLAGAALAGFGYWQRKDQGMALSARLGDGFGVVWEQAGGLYDRFLARPGGRIVGAVEDLGVPAVESGVGRALSGAGGLAGLAERGLPWVPTVLGLAVVLAVAFGLLTRGLRP